MGTVDEALYSPGRSRQLGILLWVAVVLAAAMVAFGVFFLTIGYPGYALVVVAPAVLLLGSAATSLRLLRAGGRGGKIGSVVTGAVLILIAMLFANSALSLLPSIVGVLVLLLALLRDVGDR